MMMFIYSYGVRFDVKSIKLGIADYDNTFYSRELISRFISSGYFVRTGKNMTVSEAEKGIVMGTISVALIIPADFSENLKKNSGAAVQLFLDGVDANTANISQGYTKVILLQYNAAKSKNLLQSAGRSAGVAIPPISLEIRVWYNPEMESNVFIIPGIIAIIMMLMGALLTSLSIVKEKELGSFEQIAASPIKGIEFILGKISPYIILSFIDLVMVVVVGWAVFSVPIRGSLLLLLIASLIYLVATLGLGILISTVTNTQQLAMMIAMLVTLLPSILLSGFVFPIRSMPFFLQWIAMVVPANYYLKILRDIYLKGTGLWSILPHLLVLMLLAGLLILISAKRFKKRLD
jgi:ABC-2 type transport system permease protein